MLKKRLIPVLLLREGQLVRSERFAVHQIIGNPIHEVERFNEWTVDELIYIDIDHEPRTHHTNRDDQKIKSHTSTLDILEAVAKHCFMPLTFGGGIRTLEDVRSRLSRGADKVTIRRAAFATPNVVEEAARAFGSQAVVGVIDARARPEGGWDVVVDASMQPLGVSPAEWARRLVDLGVGEILIQSVDRDGTARGYDIPLIESVAKAASVPVIALGGVGGLDDFSKAIQEGGAAAAAAANIFHFVELSDRRAKRAMAKAGVPVRT